MPDQVGHDVIAGLTGNLICYASPTNPKVATLIRTEDGKTSLKAVWQA